MPVGGERTCGVPAVTAAGDSLSSPSAPSLALRWGWASSTLFPCGGVPDRLLLPASPAGVPRCLHRAGQLLSHVCFVGCQLSPPVHFEELGAPVPLFGCETCLPLKLRQAPEKLCWHPLLTEIGLRPNTQFFLDVSDPVFV